MPRFDHRRYRPARHIALPDRQWPDRVLKQAPQWCSVDLRDGNQALIEPMNPTQKMRMWQLLVETGFTQIEIGFPAASQPDFDFTRQLIVDGHIPEHVTIQVLVQARKELIERTFEALQGVPRAIVHLYNSTSPVQREKVFGTDVAGVRRIAEQGAKWVRECAALFPETDWTFQYSPESFSQTEPEVAAEICDAVVDIWAAHARRIIVNLPATVEASMPNQFADQVELFCRLSRNRARYALSVHTHNDRGCAVAAAELAQLAGADRVEGTLLGNGERTGNMDIVTAALNLYSQGIDPKLDLSRLDRIAEVVSQCTRLPVHPRHPYAGELVYTAFSGSHQDAIRKCLARQSPDEPWQVAYLPLDPGDVGRSYQDVIRINSQSGKGGVAYVLERDHQLQLPRWMQIEASRVVQKQAEARGGELTADDIGELFFRHFATRPERRIECYRLHNQDSADRVEIQLDGINELFRGHGSGPLEATLAALAGDRHSVSIVDYSEHALGAGSDARAAAYVLLSVDGERRIGMATAADSTLAAMQAVVNAAPMDSAFAACA